MEGAESVGSWPALSEVAQKARKESEKENKPLRGDSVGGAEEGEGGKEKKGGSVGGGGGERRVSVGGVTMAGGGGGTMEKTSEGDANGDSQRYSGRRKGTLFSMPSTAVQLSVLIPPFSCRQRETQVGPSEHRPSSFLPPPSLSGTLPGP